MKMKTLLEDMREQGFREPLEKVSASNCPVINKNVILSLIEQYGIRIRQGTGTVGDTESIEKYLDELNLDSIIIPMENNEK